jgi:hypothetical protein
MRRFDGANGQVTEAGVIKQCVRSVGTIPQAFLCSRNFRIYCIHNPSKFQPSFDGTTSPWDDGIFAFLGDVMANYCTSIRIPPDILNPVQVRAFSEDYMQTNLDNLADPTGLFESPPAEHAEASIVRAGYHVSTTSLRTFTTPRERVYPTRSVGVINSSIIR